MSFSQGKLEGEEEGSVCEGVIGGGGFGRGSIGDVQHEFGSGSAVCRDSPGDDRKGPGSWTFSGQKKVKG